MKTGKRCMVIGLLLSCSMGSYAQGKFEKFLKNASESIKKELNEKPSAASKPQAPAPNAAGGRASSHDPVRWLGQEEEFKALLEAQFPHGLREIALGPNRIGFADKTGKLVVPAIYLKVVEVDVTESYMILCRRVNGKIKKSIFHTNGKRLLGGEFDNIWFPLSGLIKVKQGNKVGFFNLNDEQVIPFIYDDNESFPSYFAGNYGYMYKGEKRGVIDRTGKVIVPFGKYSVINHFSGGVAAVGILKKGFITNPYYLKRKGYKLDSLNHYVDYLYWGVIDTTGKVIIDIKHYYGHDYLKYPTLVSLNAEPIIIPEVKRIIIWSDVAPLVGVSGQSPHIGFAGVFDFTGKQLIPFAYQMLRYNANERSFSGNSAYGHGTFAIYDVNGKLLLKDKLGQEDADRSEDELYAGARPVFLNRTGKDGKSTVSYCAVVDGSGNYIMQPTDKYLDINEFLPSGYAWAQNKSEKWGMIDKTGKTVVDFKFDKVNEYKPYKMRQVYLQNYASNNGMNVHGYQAYVNNYDYFKKNCSTNCVIDKNHLIWRREICRKYLAYVGIALPEQKNKMKWGLVDDQGRVILEPKYNNIGDFDQGIALVENDRLFGIIDDEGKELAAPQFQEIRLNGGLGNKTENSIAKMINFSDQGVAIVRYPDKSYNLMNKQGQIILDKNIFYHNEGFMTSSQGLLRYQSENGARWIDEKGRVIADFDNFTDDGDFAFIVRGGKVGIVGTSYLDPERDSNTPVYKERLVLIDFPQLEYYMSGGRNRFNSNGFKAIYIDAMGNRTSLSNKDMEFFLVGNKYMSGRKLTQGMPFTASTIYDGYCTYKGFKLKLRFSVYK